MYNQEEDQAIPTISPALVPTKSPGTLFNAFTTDETLNIRWLVAADPALFEVINRPIADVALRQLVLAKAVDNLQLRLGHQTLFPYVVQPQVSAGTDVVDVPINLIWDIHASLPKKWERLRLAKIKRMSGSNSATDGYSGTLRFIFTANVEGSSTEVAILYADYRIDSNLTFQPVRLKVVSDIEESTVVDPGEEETVSGFLIFKTLDTDVEQVQAFYDLLEPPVDTTDSNSDGLYDNPAIYELIDTVSGGSAVTDDFSTSSLSHGTGLLTDSAWNAIPQLDSDIQSWLTSFNYPFDASANRRSIDNIVIPNGLFREFDIAVPAGDQPTNDSTGTFYPVWITRIERVGTGSSQLRLYFATYNITDSESGGTPSTESVEFATLDLLRSYTDGEIVEVSPIDNLLLEASSDTEFWQHFGRGHVVLSSLWNKTTTEIDDFFDAFDFIVDNPADTEFTQSSTRISSFGLSRVPKYIPTIGQSRALVGSTSRRTSPIYPSDSNRYVCEQDQGLGNQVDLESESGVTPNSAIDRYGFTGSLTHRCVRLVVDATMLGTDPTFYDTQILPRLRVLFGRDPVFADVWFNGTRFMTYNGDTWIG